MRRRAGRTEEAAKSSKATAELIPVRLLDESSGSCVDGEWSEDEEGAIEIVLRSGDLVRARGRLGERLARRIGRLLERDRC